MSKGGGGSTRTVTQSVGPPAYAKPFLKYGMSEAKRLYKDQPSYYPGATTVGFAPETEMALAGTRQRALDGSPLIGATQDVVMQNLMGTNPLMSAAFQPAVQQVQAQAAKAGRYGSGYQQGALGAALAPMAYQAQQDAIAQAPAAYEFGFADLAKLAGVGETREAQDRAELQADIDRFNFEQGQPLSSLANYMAAIQGGTIGEEKVTPYFRNPTGDFLSGLSGLAGVGKAFGLF